MDQQITIHNIVNIEQVPRLLKDQIRMNVQHRQRWLS